MMDKDFIVGTSSVFNILGYAATFIFVNIISILLGTASGRGEKKKANWILACGISFIIGILVGILYML